jgi:hypothetical protein
MALWSDTVYEAVRSGVSLGLFTVTGALQRKDENEAVEWIAEGTWQSASDIKAKPARKPLQSTKVRQFSAEEAARSLSRRSLPLRPPRPLRRNLRQLVHLLPLLRRLRPRRRPLRPQLHPSSNRHKKIRLRRIKTARPSNGARQVPHQQKKLRRKRRPRQ